MRSFYYLATAAFVAGAAAQSLQDLQALPQCAQTPAETAFAATGCGLNEPTCVCKNADFQTSLTKDVQKDCQPDDQVKVLKFATDFCAKAGITVNVPQTTEAAAQSLLDPTPAPSPSSSEAPPPPPTTSSEAPPPPSSSSSSTSPSSTTSLQYPTASVVSYNGTNSSSFGTPESFFGAAPRTSGSWALGCSVGMAVLGLLML